MARTPRKAIIARRAIDFQLELAPRVETIDRPADGDLIAAFDVSCDFGSNLFFAACCLFERDEPWKEVDSFTGRLIEDFPYIPGLLSFRELPSILNVWEYLPKRLKSHVGLLLLDGHGIAHPRGIGLASHLGLELDLPSIGVAKHPFVGDKEGRWRHLEGRRVSCEVVPKGCRKPVYVSAGHRVSPESAVAIVEPMLQAGVNPLKAAHNSANEARKAANY